MPFDADIQVLSSYDEPATIAAKQQRLERSICISWFFIRGEQREYMHAFAFSLSPVLGHKKLLLVHVLAAWHKRAAVAGEIVRARTSHDPHTCGPNCVE